MNVYFLISLLIFIVIAISGNFARAQEITPTPTSIVTNTEGCPHSDLNKCIQFFQDKVNELGDQGKTLSSQIAVMDNQIRLTETRISATKREIQDLALDIDTTTKKISQLQGALESLSAILIARVVATYEIGKADPLQILLSSNDFSSFFSRVNYLRVVQIHDKKLLYDTQQAKNDYTNQKEIFENKKRKVETLKEQLEAYTLQLDQEKKAKQSLLDITKNDEKRYQQLLARARAEFEAIQNITAGRGEETLVKDVSEGQKIASVITGSSCNSSGEHLHLIVSRGVNTENPFNYLNGGIDYENCSGSSCNSNDGDSFNPTGSWNWPINPKIRMNQGYGSTWAVKYTWVGRIYSFHNGIDIVGSSTDVKAVRDGALYHGHYSGGGGCQLRYVKIKHKDSDVETLYLHVNYVF